MRKRICHYLILALVLVLFPALCAWIAGDARIWDGVRSFPPRTEFLLHDWKSECPFSWYWMLGYAGFVLLCTFALLRRAFLAMIGRPVGSVARWDDSRVAHAFPWWGWLGMFVIGGFWMLSWSRIPCLKSVQPHLSYMPLWAGYILVMNALCVRRSGTSPMTRHVGAYLILFPVSALFWWFFEYLNRYVWNWYYEGVAHMGAFEYAFYATICFSSVLPAVVSTAAWLHTFRAFQDGAYDGMAKVDLRRPGWCSFLGVLAAIGLTGIVFMPHYTYPLLWISPVTVFILVQILLGEPSVLDRIRTGNWALFFRFAVAALICGFAWETWNWHAVAKWVYSVPFVYGFRIWEMPIAGFAGYLPFGIECAAVSAWILPALVEDGEGRATP